jgi:BASS family bile acid:Na+ symporter
LRPVTSAFDSTLVIRVLTIAALSGLLLAVGLRLRWTEVVAAVQRSRLVLVLAVNFAAVPLLALALARVFQPGRDMTIGMILLAAAPFAPVVPVFARLARADLALAAGLTALFPFLSALLTPLVCVASLKAVPGAEGLRFDFLSVLGVLVATITLPLAAGVVVNHWRPALAGMVLRPIEVLSEAIGAASLAFVTVVEFQTVVAIGWKPLVAMGLVTELSLLAGFAAGGSTIGARRVVALGTSNRNIALAVLVAINSFPGTPVVGAVVANGLLLILLGLVHVAWWRFGRAAGERG